MDAGREAHAGAVPADILADAAGCLLYTSQLPRYIMEQLDRGVTSWTGRGGWTGDEVQVLCVCLSKYEIDTLQDVLRRVDPDAFYIVQEGVHACLLYTSRCV